MHTGLASAVKAWISTQDVGEPEQLRRVRCAYHGDPANINPSPYGLILGRVSVLRYA